MPGHGPALTQADDATIVRELRALHANVTRSQYPLSSLMLDQLDRAGILLWTEAPIYHADELLHTSAQRNAALATLRGSVLQTRNHPSVFAESIANELSPTPDVVPATRSYIDAAVRLVRQLDPGTPVALDVLSYPNYPPQQTFLQFDLLGIDNYFGWYTGRPGIHSTANINWLAPYLRTTHARYPHQALVMTEFGAEADVPGPITEKQTYAFQTRYLEDTLGIVDSLPFMNGALYWTVREFAVKPFWDGGAHRNDVPRTAIHHKGLISYTGVPKPAFGVAARLFAHTPLYRSPPPLAPAGSPDNGPSIPGGFAPLVSVLAALLLLGAVLALRPRWRAARREETEPVPSPDSVSP
jgi:beta-glucuronidase